ncbi:MAG: hypothetical protein SVV80_10740 [Planctomycetota bacterium]|nr:hypothetical protein [Planctomycetota bacterium]
MLRPSPRTYWRLGRLISLLSLVVTSHRARVSVLWSLPDDHGAAAVSVPWKSALLM